MSSVALRGRGGHGPAGGLCVSFDMVQMGSLSLLQVRVAEAIRACTQPHRCGHNPETSSTQGRVGPLKDEIPSDPSDPTITSVICVEDLPTVSPGCRAHVHTPRYWDRSLSKVNVLTLLLQEWAGFRPRVPRASIPQVVH